MQKKTAVKLGETKEAAATAVEKTTGVKVENVKIANVTEAAKNVVAEKKEVVKEKAKTAAKKATTKKDEKESLKPEVFIQFQGQEAVVEEVIKKATDEYVAAGHRATSIKSLQVYLKPEDNAAYYVINQKAAGKVDLF
ncbi:MAG: DUF6465 family protein [Roseburia sp.]